MATTAFNPLTIAKGIAVGANGRATFGHYLDETLLHGATSTDLRQPSRVKTWINTTDIARNTPFLFSPETFDVLSSAPSKLPVSEAVAASAAFPILFAPVVLESYAAGQEVKYVKLLDGGTTGLALQCARSNPMRP
jgi:NTE family protein